MTHQETPLLWGHAAERPIQFRDISFSAESDFRLKMCDNSYGMSSYPIVVYPRVNEECYAHTKYESKKVKLKKDSSQDKVKVS